MIQQAIAKLSLKEDLTREEARASMEQIMSGEASAKQIAEFLVALRVKGETVEEVTGCTLAMREKATKVRTKHALVIDTCGTGGDAVGTFNVSTAAALVACGAGVAVAKHGNRAVSSRCGSADVLKALGVRVEDVAVETMERCLDQVGMAFLYAPTLHGAMKYAAPVRKELGVRTIFNILGPMTNPAEVRRQVIGVYDSNLTETIAAVLRELGSEHVLVVHGEGGFDEISTCGPTKVTELKDGEIRTYSLDPKDTGLPMGKLEAVLGGDAAANAGIIESILAGEEGRRRDIVLLNAAAALLVAGVVDDLRQAMRLAEESIDTGRARKVLDGLIEVSNA